MVMQMRGVSGNHPEFGMLASRPVKPPRLNESQSSASLSPKEDSNSLPAACTIAASDNLRQTPADAEWDKHKEHIIQL